MKTKAHIEVIAERQRQIIKGYRHDVDDTHTDRELAMAAAAYAYADPDPQWKGFPPPDFWPWSDELWKPGTYRQNLVKAAALLLAEIERIDRAEAKEHP